MHFVTQCYVYWRQCHKRKKSHSRFEGLDSLTDGGVCITSDLLLALFPPPPTHTSSTNSTLQDPSRSPRDASRLSVSD